MIYSRSLNFVFIHIHKTGGSSMEVALDPHLSWEDIVLGSTLLGEAMNDPYRRRYGLHKHSSIQDVQNICGSDLVGEAYCFATVRHPVSRICSLYNFVGTIVSKWAVDAGVLLDAVRVDMDRFIKIYPPLSWPASLAFVQSHSFDEFLERPELARDDAFLSQVSRLSLEGQGLVCEALRLEDIEKWLPNLSLRLGIDLHVPHENSSEQKLISANMLSMSTKKRIQTMFYEDFDAFGYEPL